MRTHATELAQQFALPASAVAELAWVMAFASAVLKYPKPPSIRDRERGARRRLKADPADNDAWCELHRIQAGRAPIAVDLDRRQWAVLESRANRDGRRQPDEPLNVAVLLLRDFWNRHQPDRPVTRYDGTGKAAGRAGSRMAPSPGVVFIQAALQRLGVHPVRVQPRSIRHRLS